MTNWKNNDRKTLGAGLGYFFLNLHTAKTVVEKIKRFFTIYFIMFIDRLHKATITDRYAHAYLYKICTNLSTAHAHDHDRLKCRLKHTFCYSTFIIRYLIFHKIFEKTDWYCIQKLPYLWMSMCPASYTLQRLLKRW